MRERFGVLRDIRAGERGPLPSWIVISALLIATCVLGAGVGLFLGGPSSSAGSAGRAADWARTNGCGGTWRQVSVRSAGHAAVRVPPEMNAHLVFDRPRSGELVTSDGVNAYTLTYRLGGAPDGAALRVDYERTALAGYTKQTAAGGRDEAAFASMRGAHPAGLTCTSSRLVLAIGAYRLVYAR